jgi:hypothetical protein
MFRVSDVGCVFVACAFFIFQNTYFSLLQFGYLFILTNSKLNIFLCPFGSQSV